MKVLDIVWSVNLVLAGMLAGNEFGTWAAVHPSPGKLGPAERISPERGRTRVPGRRRAGRGRAMTA
jgi:hypothetical protein